MDGVSPGTATRGTLAHVPATHRPVATAAAFAARFGDAPVSVRQALAAGFTPGQLRAAVSHGALARPRHGVVQVGRTVDEAGRFEQLRADHLAEIQACLVSVGGRAHATEKSAGIVHRLPLRGTAAPERVSLVRPGVPDFDGPGLRLRGTEIPAHFLVVVEGTPVTDVRRTAVDLARSQPLPRALEVLDAAARRLIAGWTGAVGNDLRRAALDPELRRRAEAELAYAVAACVGFRGIVAVRRALPLVDPAAESPLESRSRGWFARAGLSLAVGQPVRAGGRTYWVDFLEPDRKVVGEADGWGKYGETPDDIRAAMATEKARQADLESAGYRVVRWSSDDPSAVVVARMRNALRRD